MSNVSRFAEAINYFYIIYLGMKGCVFMSKVDQVRDIFEKGGNLHLFKEIEEGFQGSIAIPKLQKSFFVMLSLPNGNFYNTITIILADVPPSKMNEAIRLANRLNSDMRSGAYYVLQGKNYGDDGLFIYREPYTVLDNDFDEEVFNVLLISSLEKFEKGDDYKEIMRMIWS